MTTYLLTEASLQGFIDEINKCQEKNGSSFVLPKIDEPGLSNFLITFIQVIEKAMISSFEPIVKLKQMVTDYLVNPPVFLQEILKFIEEIKSAIENPIEFIVNKILEPISKNILMPISIDLSFIIPDFKIEIDEGFKTLPKEKQEEILQMINAPKEIIKQLTEEIENAKLEYESIINEIKIPIDEKITEINSKLKVQTDLINKKYETFKGSIDEKNELFNAEISKLKEEIELEIKQVEDELKLELDKQKVKLEEKLKELSQQIIEAGKDSYFVKMLEFVLLPIKMAIGIFKAIIELIATAVANAIVEIPKLITKLVTNFLETMTEMILKIVTPIMQPLIESIAPAIKNIEGLMVTVGGFIKDVFTGSLKDISEYIKQNKDFELIFGFISIIGCFFKSILSFLILFPTLIF